MPENDLISQVETGDATSTTTQDDFLSELVGEGKPFKDTQALARGKAESDKFIEQVQRENAELRESVKKLEEATTTSTALSDVLSAINQSKTDGGDNQTALTADDISQLVASSVSQIDQGKTKAQNRERTNQAALQAFGGDKGKALAHLVDKRRSLGLSSEQVRTLSEESPNAFIKLFELDKTTIKPPTSTSVQSDVNTQAFVTQNQNSGERTYSYYRNLRKEMGFSKYYGDFNLQKQFQADQDRLGEAFDDVT
jgi:hypothetical protein